MATAPDAPKPAALENERAEQVDALLVALSSADSETLDGLRGFLLDEMFPSMPDQARQILLPVFALVTLEARSR